MFLLVPAYPGCPGSKTVKRLCLCVCVCLILVVRGNSSAPQGDEVYCFKCLSS